MPGSHDAGIYTGDAVQTGITKPSLTVAICQDGSIYEQCMWGSRFFDVRLKIQGDGSVKTYHQFAGQGAVGGSDNTILDDVNRFLSNRGSEFVILRISKTSATKTGILQTIAQHPIASKLYLGFGNIAKEKIGNLRGKAICVFDHEKIVLNPQDQAVGLHPFGKWKGADYVVGIQTCGAYANDKSIRNVFSSQLAHTNKHLNHPRNHLFVLYWTQTGGNIGANTYKALNDAKAFRKGRAAGGAYHNMDYMLKILSEPGVAAGGDTGRFGESWSVRAKGKIFKTRVQPTTWQDRRDHMPNVIMYDFVNRNTSEQIVMLNQPNLQGVLIDELV